MPDAARPTGADLIITERAYHFVGDTLCDGRPVPPDGEWLVHDGPVELCVSGLHASRRPWDALKYAPGETLCLVEIADIAAEDTEKLVARRRRIVRRVDLTADLRAFARACARDVLSLWDAPDVVRRYLAGDETLRAAAWDAHAAWYAAKAAERAAAWAAASAAALDAARVAAWNAASNAALAAAWAAEGAASRKALGPWTAAWATAWGAHGARFDALCRARLGVEEVV